MFTSTTAMRISPLAPKHNPEKKKFRNIQSCPFASTSHKRHSSKASRIPDIDISPTRVVSSSSDRFFAVCTA